MILFILAFLSGDLFFQTFTRLPTFYEYVIFLIMLAPCILLKTRYKYILLGFALGFFWTAWFAVSLLAWSLPLAWEGRPLMATGYITSLPIQDHQQTSFIFLLHQLTDGNISYKKKSLIRLSIRDDLPQLKVGDKWRFQVKLKRIHGTQNPGAFDFERWAYHEGLRATGYVLSNKNKSLNSAAFISHSWYHAPINQIRQLLQKKISARMPNTPTAPWLLALTLGERQHIAEEDWEVLRKTGTNHLMAIAGLHIGLLAGFVHLIVSWTSRFFPIVLLYYPANIIAAFSALICAILYSALAGFSLPAQRASLMFIILVMVTMKRQKIHAWQVWSQALLLVLLINPLNVLTESFYLSFGTIALIIFGMSGRLSPKGLWWKWGRVQWVVGLGLIPLSLFFFQEGSLVSFIANSIAIPWLGFFILPFCFLSMISLLISPPIAAFLLFLADKSLTGLWFLLTWFSHLPIASWHQVIPDISTLFFCIGGFLLLLMPAGLPGRVLGIIWILPLIFHPVLKPKKGEYWLSLLDVGQGLSVVVQTKEHILVYDAGSQYRSQDMGKSVVLPYLYTINAHKIDTLVISHGDNDHIGGAFSLIKALPITLAKSSVPEKLFFSPSSFCLSGETWEWDKVNFSFIYPSKNDLDLNNDSSCVLQIDNGTHRVLLTGDIEKYAEEQLLSNPTVNLASTLLVAPHHGSKTSGLKEFISVVHPSIVLYPTGYKNRYHFPHDSIVSAFTQLKAEQFNTAETGAIQFQFGQQKKIDPPQLFRVNHRHYWQDV